MADTSCLDGCEENEATPLASNQMPLLFPAGSGGGGSGSVQVIDTSSINMEGDGTSAAPLQASLKISSSTAGNMATVAPDGLAVPHELPANGTTGQVLAKNSDGSYDVKWVNPAAASGVTTEDTSTVDFSGNGLASTPLVASVKVSPEAGNAVEVRPDGLFLPPGLQGPQGQSMLPDEYGILTDAKVAMIEASGEEWLFLVNADNGGTLGDQRANQAIPAGITGDMQGHLVRYDPAIPGWTDHGPVVGVPGPAGAGVAAGGTAGQVLSKASGVDYATQWIDPPATAVNITDSNTVDLSGDGTDVSPLTAGVRLDPAPTNTLSASAAGLNALRELPLGGTTGQVLKKINDTDYNVAWANDDSAATVSTSDTETVNMSGDGQSGSPISATVIVDSATTNKVNVLTSGANGLMVNGLEEITAKAGAASTAVLAENLKYLDFNAATAQTYTVPPNSSVAFPIGSVLEGGVSGTGGVTIAAGAGVTIIKQAAQSLTLPTGMAFRLVKTATDTWQFTSDAGGGSGGGSTITVQDSDSIDLTGDGSGATPLSAAVKLDPADGNQLTVSAAGAMVNGLAQIVAKGALSQTALLSDNLKYVHTSNAAAKSYTIPPNSSVAFPLGSVIHLFNSGAGNLTVIAGSGVTIIKKPTQTLEMIQGGAASLTKISADTWHMVGGMEAI